MELFMRVGQPLEMVLEDGDRLLDAWEAGGVRGLVVGRLYFDGPDGRAVPCFAPNPEVYRALEMEPPPPPAVEFPEMRARLDRFLGGAHARGWPILLFSANWGAPAAGRHAICDPAAARAGAARTLDCLSAFPMTDGAVFDGPEWGYEIDPKHRSYLFNDLPESVAPFVEAMGYGYAALCAARDRGAAGLRSVTRAGVGACAGGGLLGAFALLGSDPGLFAWLRFRMEAMTHWARALRDTVRAAGIRAQIGWGPRTPAFAPLAGYDLATLGEALDWLLPKHYFWHRGYDGLYGTVARAVATLCRWNPGLSEEDAFTVVRLLYGIALPGVHRLSDMDGGFPPEFFADVVAGETRRALAAMPDPGRVLPWVDTGRRPHDGDPMPAGDLRRILRACRDAGLRRFLYHSHTHLTAAEWSVIAEECGSPSPGYRPPDHLHVMPR